MLYQSGQVGPCVFLVGAYVTQKYRAVIASDPVLNSCRIDDGNIETASYSLSTLPQDRLVLRFYVLRIQTVRLVLQGKVRQVPTLCAVLKSIDFVGDAKI